MADQAPKNTAIDIALNKYCDIKSIAHVLGVIRPDGGIAIYISDELKTQPKRLVTALHDELLKASGSLCHSNMLRHEYEERTADVENEASDDESIPSQKRAVPTLPTRAIAIGDDAARNEIYEECLKNMQQDGCKVLGKAWVKLLEPKKQSTYPYTKGAQKSPPWWPAMTGPNKIRHKEPDHLHKRERVILLIHIAGLVADQNSRGPAARSDLNIAKLEKVTREAMASWFADKKKPKNAKKRSFLDQLFRVLYEEERYRRGELDASATVSINQDGDDEDSGPSPRQTQSASPIPPFFPAPPSRLLPSATTTAAPANYYPSPRPLLPSFIPSTRDTTIDEYTSTYPYTMSNHGLPIHQQRPPQQPTYTPQTHIRHPQRHDSCNIYPPPRPTSQQFAYALPTISSPHPPERQSADWMQPPMARVGGEADTFGGVDGKVLRGYADGGWGWEV